VTGQNEAFREGKSLNILGNSKQEKKFTSENKFSQKEVLG
jgi:hypothetical protein